tara:strand:- start:45 stop:566 length:522 start_codon:yes stop_codon:yes gene_type:complete
MKKNYKIFIILVTLLLILMFIKNTDKYSLSIKFTSHCTHEIGSVDSYYKIIPKNIWVNSVNNGVKIYTHFKDLREFTKKRNEILKLANQILLITSEKKPNYLGKPTCFINYSNLNNKDFFVKINPKLILVSQEIYKNTNFVIIRYLTYLIFVFSMFFILKRFQKINFLNLYRQ